LTGWRAACVAKTEIARTGTKLQIPSEIRNTVSLNADRPHLPRATHAGPLRIQKPPFPLVRFETPIADICLRIAILLVLRPRMQHKPSMRVSASWSGAAMPKAALRKRTADNVLE
jgi:hypothetical protein